MFKEQLLSFLSNVYVRLDRRPRLVVTSYHRVGKGSHIQQKQIRRQFEFLAKHYQMVLPSQLPTIGNRKRFAMVTIDDCHADIYKYIFPVAKSLNIPFTICVPTDFLFRDHWLWFDKLYWMLNEVSSGIEIEIAGHKLETGNAKSIENIKNILKAKLPEERDQLLTDISSKLQCKTPESPSEYYRPVAVEEMKEMLESGLMEICAHTITHTISTVLNDEQLRCELELSKKELEDFFGREIPSFCYPNGNAGDFDDRTTRIARSAGFSAVFTSIEGSNLLNNMDPYRIKRVHAHRHLGVFKKLASGLGDFIKAV